MEAKSYYEISLELGEIGKLGHNEIEIQVAGSDFRYKVKVLGDSKPSFADARQLLGKDRYIVHYEVEGKVIDLRRLRYAPNDVRHLKIRVHVDPSDPKVMPKIEKLHVRYAEAVLGEEVTRNAALLPREPARGDGGPGSSWLIDLSDDPVPFEKLIFTVDGPPVDRHSRIDVVDKDNQSRYMPTKSWTWRKEGTRQLLEVEMAQETRARKLHLVITDFANEPLNLTSVQYSAAARKVIFPAPIRTSTRARYSSISGIPRQRRPITTSPVNCPRQSRPRRKSSTLAA